MKNSSTEMLFAGYVQDRSLYLRRTILIGLASVLTGVGFMALTPTVLVLSSYGPGIFFDRQEYVLDSPDLRHRVRIYRRMIVPVNEIIDPAGSVSVTVENTAASTVISEKSIGIHEYGELVEPTLTWGASSVTVKGIESHGDVEFDLPLD